MNLFELIYAAIIIVVGLCCAKLIGIYFGITGWIVGFILGGLSAVLALFGLNKLSNVLTKRFPPRPTCKTGRCSSDNYQVKGLSKEKDGVIFQCECGTQYLKKGGKFMEICDDGKIVPYMKSKGVLGRWEKDVKE